MITLFKQISRKIIYVSIVSVPASVFPGTHCSLYFVIIIRLSAEAPTTVRFDFICCRLYYKLARTIISELLCLPTKHHCESIFQLKFFENMYFSISVLRAVL